MNPSFIAFKWKNGMLFDNSNAEYPCIFHALVGNTTFLFKPGRSYFIFQYSGHSYISSTYPLLKEHYAVCTEEHSYIVGDEGSQALIVESIGSKAPFLLGGPIEKEGRLKYIDGCTDSLLLSPWKYGEPCLNHLHFPKGINQTPHTHPSIRIGLVVRGNGECITPFGNVPLEPGMLFAILPDSGRDAIGTDGAPYPEGTHSFRTFGEEMDVIAFHPDSDYGPKDEEHPMINRTIVGGVSAKLLDDIRTK